MKRLTRRNDSQRGFECERLLWKAGVFTLLVAGSSGCGQTQQDVQMSMAAQRLPSHQIVQLPELPEPDLGQGENIIAIIDDSLSMNKNDSRGWRWEGAKLVVALADEQDNFAAVGFAGDGHVLVPLTRVGGRERREAILKRLSSESANTMARNSGDWPNKRAEGWRQRTHFGDALEKAGAEVKRALPETKTSIVLLTDGQNNYPKTTDKTVLETFQRSIGDGARLTGLALRNEGDSELLRGLTTLSGGAYYPVGSADGLLDAYMKASQMMKDLILLEDADTAHEVLLLPGTRNFLLIILRGHAHAQVDLLQCGRDPIDLDTNPYLCHVKTTEFEVVNVPDPAKACVAPRWSWKVSELAGTVQAAVQPHWVFEPIRPRGGASCHEPIVVRAELISTTAFEPGFENRIEAKFRARPLDQAERPWHPMNIRSRSDARLLLQNDAGQPQLYFDRTGEWIIQVVMYVRDDEDQTWILDRNWLVDAGSCEQPQLLIAAPGERAERGAPIELRAEVRSKKPYKTRFVERLRADCTITAPNGTKLAECEMKAVRRSPTTIELRPARALSARFTEEGEWTLGCKASSGQWSDARTRNTKVEPPQTCEIAYAGPGTVDLGRVRPGCSPPPWKGPLAKLVYPCSKPVTVHLANPIRLEHSSGAVLQAEASPTSLKLAAGSTPEVRIAVVRPRADMPGGRYEGQLTLTGGASTVFPSDALPVFLELDRVFCSFDTSASFGEVRLGSRDARVEWSLTSQSCVPVLIRAILGPLRNASGHALPAECLRVNPTEFTLEGGEQAILDFSLVTSRDFPVGTFSSDVRLEVIGEDGHAVLESTTKTLEAVLARP